MTLILYNIRTADGSWRITKFIDGNPEGSYLTSHTECECPAGVRPVCRHRQMLPRMIAHDLVDQPYFWDFDRACAVDLNGNLRPLLAPQAYTDNCPSTTAHTDRQCALATTALNPIDDGPSTSQPAPSSGWRRW